MAPVMARKLEFVSGVGGVGCGGGVAMMLIVVFAAKMLLGSLLFWRVWVELVVLDVVIDAVLLQKPS
eukprot:2277713-Ditylum_brightwellii.AAC.1